MAQARWRRLTLEVTPADAEPALALLGSATGVHAALEQRVRSRTVVAASYVPVAGAAPISREVRARLRHLQRSGVLCGVALREATVRDEDWSQTWKRFYRPSKIADGLYVVPSWRPDFTAPGAAHALVLDPGQAFGTGTHATTRLAMRLMLPRIKENDVVIDAGCGSGILGIAAAMRGARVCAFDSDPLAVAATRDNFVLNHVKPAALAQAATVPKRFPRADLIVANISAAVLAPLAARFAAALKTGGNIVSTGIVAAGRLALLFHYERAGLTFAEEHRSGEWFAYVHSR
jgi:ribosomal protein L11 methyltransferase